MKNQNSNFKAIAKAFLQAASSRQVSEGYDLCVSEKIVHHNVYFNGMASNNGLYMLRVRDDEGAIKSIKVIFSSNK